MATDDKNKSARQAALDAKLDEVRACFRDSMVRYALEGVEIAMVIRLSDPQAPQKTLALDVVNTTHCDDCAAMIFEAAARIARKHAGAPPETVDVEDIVLACEGEGLRLPDALALAGLVKSKIQGMHLVEQGGVEVDQRRIDDPKHELAAGRTYFVRVGSNNSRFARLVVGAQTSGEPPEPVVDDGLPKMPTGETIQ